MRRAEVLRDHAESLLRMANATRGEDRACLRSAAREWMHIAEKLDRLDHHPPGMWLPLEGPRDTARDTNHPGKAQR